MSPNIWGPPTWVFIHTLAEKIKDDSFYKIGPSVISMIIKISTNLPCPECSHHAKEFWARVKPNNIQNKTDLINLLYVFHNAVNKRRKASLFKYTDLQYYKNKQIIETYNQFSKVFNTKGNMKLLNESFHRNFLMNSLRTWIMASLQFFDLTNKLPITI